MSTATQYHDFEIELGRCTCEQPEIRVLESRFDRPRARLELSDEHYAAIEKKVQRFDRLLLKSGDFASERRQLAREIGSDLFQILFPPPIRRTFENNTSALLTQEGLRLRLSFGQPYDHRLAGLPWELLYDETTERFIGCERETAVARYLDIPMRIDTLDVDPPARILGLVASPDPETSKRFRYHQLDVRRHLESLQQAVESAEHLELSTVANPTLEALHQELIEAESRNGPFHILHLLCHGGFNEHREGVLFFQREDGSEHHVTGGGLARQLLPSIRIVVLVSCRTADAPMLSDSDLSAFNSVASVLVAHGTPAVVAMQFNISEDAAVAFTGAFYKAIGRNKSIDDAVIEGRLAIDREGETGDVERATPVLFLRPADGRILNIRYGRRSVASDS